jgi:hypothetical protein
MRLHRYRTVRTVRTINLGPTTGTVIGNRYQVPVPCTRQANRSTICRLGPTGMSMGVSNTIRLINKARLRTITGTVAIYGGMSKINSNSNPWPRPSTPASQRCGTQKRSLCRMHGNLTTAQLRILGTQLFQGTDSLYLPTKTTPTFSSDTRSFWKKPDGGLSR